MADFRKLVLAALLAGVVGGLLLSVLQQLLTQPLLLTAESFEAPAADHGHDWQPRDGWQRLSLTVLFNILSGFGFGLLLAAAMYWHGGNGHWRGMLWGAAGYLVFFAAPSLGLPPELPGAESAALPSRQVWWLFTAFATAAGLYGLILAKNPWIRLAAALLLLAPHLSGAPQPELAQHAAPLDLQQRFVQLSALNNALFWLTLGAVTGWLMPRLRWSA